jgi:hypothetical protein
MLNDDLFYAIGSIAHVLIPSRCLVGKIGLRNVVHCLCPNGADRINRQPGKARLGTMNIGKGQDPNATIGKLPDSSSNHRHAAVDM